MKPRQPFVGFALSAIGGIVAADWLALYAGVLWPLAAGLAVFGWGIAWWLHRKTSASSAAPWMTWLAIATSFFALHGFGQTAGPGRKLDAQIPPQGRAVCAIGVVNEEPSANPWARFRVRLESITFGDKSNPAQPTSAEVLVAWTGKLPAYGDRVEILGNAYHLKGPRNPGEFDQVSIRRRQGIYTEIQALYPQDSRILAHDCGNPAITLAYRLRHAMERTMALDLENEPEIAALIQSMVLGSRSETPPEMKKLFRYTGTLHLFAVSGMNVAMLAGIMMGVLQIARLPRHRAALLAIPLLWIYCYVTGLTPSSLRATFMATVLFAGLGIDRRALGWNTLGATAFALLAWEPGQLFLPGFQLSFGMVALLMAMSGHAQKLVEPWGRPDSFLPHVLWTRFQTARYRVCSKIAEATAVSLTAWIGSMPLTIYYFHLWSPSTVPANLLAVPLAWGMLVLGLGSVAAGTCCHWLAVTLNNANWLLAKSLLATVVTFASIPGAHRFVAFPSFQPAPACEVEVLDLRGGGAIHLRVNGSTPRDWLIDCGSLPAFSHSVSPYLMSAGVNRLDGFLLTHGDSKHSGAALAMLQELTPGTLAESPYRDLSPSRRQWQKALAEVSLGKTILCRGDTLTLSPGITLRILFPPPPSQYNAGPADNKALVLRLDAGKTRLLFVSDSGFMTERWLLEHGQLEELRSDILIKGMHGKDLSGTPEFLQAVQPAVVITSAAAFPQNENVSAEWAAMVQSRGIRLLRQDQTGAIKMTLDAAGRWTVEPFLIPDAAIFSEPQLFQKSWGRL